MKILIISIALIGILYSSNAQNDLISTSEGDLLVQPILHGSLVLNWGKEVIYIDPYGGAERFKEMDDPTIILITDIHGDHLNQKTLDGLNTSRSRFFVPQAVMDKLPETLQEKATVIENGQTMVYQGIEILAIPMYNLPQSEESRHTKGRGNGYILTIGDKRIYVSGDTEDIPEMRNLKNIDVAFVCMNLPYTMDVNQAASAVTAFKPSIVYPYHYRGKGGLSDIESFKKQVEEAENAIEVRLRNWYPE